MRRATLAVLVMCALGGQAFAFGNVDQGFVTGADVNVVKMPAIYPVVDAHTHISGGDASFDVAIKSMDAAGVVVSVNLSGGSGEALDKALACAAKHPGRFVTFCGTRPTREEWASPEIGEVIAKQIQEGHDKGAQGFGEIVKWALFSRIQWDDPRLEPMWNKLEELKMPINWHVSDPSRYWRPQGPYNTLESDGYETGFPLKQELLMQQERVMDKHPNLMVIGAHSNYLADQIPQLVYRFEKYPNYYVDLSAVCGEWGRQPEEFIDVCKKYGDRLLYGTDAGYSEGKIAEQGGLDKLVNNFKAFHVAHFLFYGTDQQLIPIPWNGNYGRYLIRWDNGFTRYANNGVALPDEILRKIYYKNAERLFGIKAEGWRPEKPVSYAIEPVAEPAAAGAAY